jgi:hypothetical protein
VTDGANGITIGKWEAVNYLNGWIDEFRISKGVARWESNFAKPSAPYGPDLSGGISCGYGTTGDCEETYRADTEVTLTPTPGPDSVFTGWSGDCSGPGPCMVRMDADRYVTATFDQIPTYNLSAFINGTGLGNVVSSSHTVLLLHNDGPDGSPTFTDDSNSGHRVTVHDNAQIDIDWSMFGGASGYFPNSSTSYLTVAGHSDFNFGMGDFTIDFWGRFNDFKPGGSGTSPVIRSKNYYTAGYNGNWLFRIYAGGPSFVTLDGQGNLESVNASFPLDTGRWYHFAAVRQVEVGSGTVTKPVTDGANGITIGKWEAVNYLNGWIDELRVSKGIARWESNFTPPSAPYEPDQSGDISCGDGTINDCTEDYAEGSLVELTATPSGGSTFTGWSGCSTIDPTDGTCTVTMNTDTTVTATFDQIPTYNLSAVINGTGFGNVVSSYHTVLLLHNDGPDGSPTFTDDSNSGHIVTTHGNTQIDTAQSIFGGASGYFPNSINNYLAAAGHSDFDFGTGEFTIDFWGKFNDFSPGTNNFSPVIVSKNCDVAGYDGNWLFKIYAAFGPSFGTLNGTGDVESVYANFPLNTGQWYHFAAVRQGNTLRLYVDGNEVGSGTVTKPLMDGANGITIGMWDGNYLNGWIDELRVSKGIARWTSDFTPPTGPYGSDLSGGIDCGDGTTGDCSETYLEGTEVTLTATPGANSIFTGWFGCSTINPTDDTCTATMNADIAVTATFDPAFAIIFTPARFISAAWYGYS